MTCLAEDVAGKLTESRAIGSRRPYRWWKSRACVEENAAWGRRALSMDQRVALCTVEQRMEERWMQEDALQEMQDAFKKELRRAKRKAMWEMQRQDRVDAALARKAREERVAEARREHGRALLRAGYGLVTFKNGMVEVREYEPADKDGWVLNESGAWVECEEVVRGRR